MSEGIQRFVSRYSVLGGDGADEYTGSRLLARRRGSGARLIA